MMLYALANLICTIHACVFLILTIVIGTYFLNLIQILFIFGALTTPQLTFANLNIQNHVVGGTNADILAVPWQVYIQISKANGTFACGGTLIAERWVLTAAHCFNNGTRSGDYVPVDVSEITIFSGSADLSKLSQLRANSVSRLIVHASFRQDINANDIALLELQVPVPSPAQPIRLMVFSTQIDADFEFGNAQSDNLFLSGWGRTSTDGNVSTQVLQKTTLDGVADITCARAWRWANTSVTASNFICANATDKGSCSGDSGGPLVWQDKNAVGNADRGYRLAGIVSFGNAKQCAYNPLPDVYTQVSNYTHWIKDNIVTYQGPTPNFSVDVFDIEHDNVSLQSNGKKGGLFGPLFIMFISAVFFSRGGLSRSFFICKAKL
jgi:secreted trypsin-like serine protease